MFGMGFCRICCTNIPALPAQRKEVRHEGLTALGLRWGQARLYIQIWVLGFRVRAGRASSADGGCGRLRSTPGRAAATAQKLPSSTIADMNTRSSTCRQPMTRSRRLQAVLALGKGAAVITTKDANAQEALAALLCLQTCQCI